MSIPNSIVRVDGFFRTVQDRRFLSAGLNAAGFAERPKSNRSKGRARLKMANMIKWCNEEREFVVCELPRLLAR